MKYAMKYQSTKIDIQIEIRSKLKKENMQKEVSIKLEKINEAHIPKRLKSSDNLKKYFSRKESDINSLTSSLSIMELSKKTEKLSKDKEQSEINEPKSGTQSAIKKEAPRKKTNIKDFTFIENLGKGSYAQVEKVKYNENEQVYALKKINKGLLDKLEKDHEVFVERYCLLKLDHPNILKLYKTFQNHRSLFFLLEYCPNKDLGSFLRNNQNLDFFQIQFYAAEILNGLEYMHKHKIIHRDLKPENIGLDKDFHLKIFDFGTAYIQGKYFENKTKKFIDIDKNIIQERLLEVDLNESSTISVGNFTIKNMIGEFVGTAEYVSPEFLNKKFGLIGPAVDLWAFGVILYQLFEGHTPFKGKDDSETIENIKNLNYFFSDNCPMSAQDLIQLLLVKDPTQRIGFGCRDYQVIKSHPFFMGIDFKDLHMQNVPCSHMNLFNKQKEDEKENYKELDN